VVLSDAFPNFSICGLPYYLSGDVPDWRSLAHRTTADLEQAGIELLLDHTAHAIDPARKQVTVTSQHGGERQLSYDRLVIGTGAVPVRPPIDGLDLPGVYVLHTMADTFALHQALAAGAGSAVIVGGGYIGLEMAEAFTARGLEVTLVEQAPAVMPTVDLELGRLLGEELGRHEVQVVNDVTVKAIHSEAGGLTVAGEPDFAATADLVLVVVGVRPDTELAVAAGVQAGVRGAIRVDRRMRTNLPGVLAAGDCVETWHRLLDRPAYLPLGTTAHKQGRIAGETGVGGDREFAGSLGTQVVKVFELAVARTGLRDPDAADAGFHPLTVGSVQYDHKAYYPGAHQLHLRLTGDRQTGQLLGAQLVGHHDAEVAKRIDIAAGALFHHMTVEALNDLDLSYTPPFGSPWDAVQLAAQDWVRQTGPCRLDLGVHSKVYPAGMALTVSALADQVGLRADTVRYYERVGLLPKPARSAAGYRLYDQAAVGRLRLIKGAQRAGLRLRDIGELLQVADRGQCPCGHTETLLKERLAEVQAELARLQALEAELTRLLEHHPDPAYPETVTAAADWWCAPDCPDPCEPSGGR
jgi:NADPH-dependent 2,4-dienoyl-CoA reductase/sulfur reductase-like enzyme/DNA-binding transcriptional MerR regulator